MCALPAIQCRLICRLVQIISEIFLWQVSKGGGVRSGWTCGCIYQVWMGVVGSGGKSPEGETFKYSVFVDSRVEDGVKGC